MNTSSEFTSGSPVSGSVAAESYFRFTERHAFDPECIIDVLRGKYLGIIYRDVIDPQVADSLLKEFWRNPATRHRADVSSYLLGTYHFDKSVETYLTEAAEIRPSIESLVRTEGSPWVWFNDIVGDKMQREGMDLRVAQMDGRKACPALIRSWDAEGAFALYPHEDTSQCRDPRQAGFEIQRAVDHNVCAVNMCLANGEGGCLVMWNVRPDEETRERLSVQHTGFPYPPSGLAEFDELRLNVRAGDIYVFNGAYVHAVEASLGVRANLSFFIGILDERTAVTWT